MAVYLIHLYRGLAVLVRSYSSMFGWSHGDWGDPTETRRLGNRDIRSNKPISVKFPHRFESKAYRNRDCL